MVVQDGAKFCVFCIRKGPSSPIVENLTAVDRGLTISWKSDVTSRQDMYLVKYVRNDTGETFNATTVEGHIVIDDLYPGAAYNLQLFAVSHNLLSEKHEYFQTVCMWDYYECLFISCCILM